MTRAKCILLLVLAACPAGAADLARGEALFQPCRACHSREATTTGMAGPHLAGLTGRKVGGAAGYDYSPVLAAARDAGLVWDDARLKAFLGDPEGMFPGLWMNMRGLRKDEDRAALAAYLLDTRP